MLLVLKHIIVKQLSEIKKTQPVVIYIVVKSNISNYVLTELRSESLFDSNELSLRTD